MATKQKQQKGKGTKAKKREKKRKKRTLASKADKFLLYQKSVQDPKPEVRFMDRVFRRHRKRRPLHFREDFCGTAYLATHWVKSHKKRTALGVDLDGPTLEYARKKVIGKEAKSVAKRIALRQENVLAVTEPKVDIACAFNFSYCIFKKRSELGAYLKVAHDSLADDGLFFCELFGGTEAIEVLDERRQVEDFTYIWQQAKFNPITREILCHIHFAFKDGSKLKQAFTYDWRLWTVPELRELMAEAGFSKTEVWWDPVDEDDYRVTEEEENQAGWLVYLVGIK